MLLPLHQLHFLWLSSLGAHCMRPAVSPPKASNQSLTVHSVSFTVVVVEGSVSVTHVTVCGFFLLFAVNALALVLVRLRLFPVAPLVLHDVLQKDPRALVGRRGGRQMEARRWRKSKSNGPYVAWQELDDHAHDERRPEDVQELQGAHQPIEEVVANEGRVEAQWVHHCCVDDPA